MDRQFDERQGGGRFATLTANADMLVIDLHAENLRGMVAIEIGHSVAAPFAGVVSLAVQEGATVGAGAVVATIEAMKMEASITTPVAGTVKRLAIGSQQQVEGGDLLLVVA